MYLLLLAIITAVPFGTSKAQTPSSCLIIRDSSITEQSPGNYVLYIRWHNPTSGSKSFQVKAGSCLTTCCINAKYDGDTSLFFTCTERPVIQFTAFTGGVNCHGNNCSVEVNLPLKLISFTAKKIGEKAQLSWSAVTESNDKSIFRLERSVDGNTFKEILIMFPKQGGGSYTYTDDPAANTLVFYRLRVDENEKRSYSKVIKVSFIAESKLTVSIAGKTLLVRGLVPNSTLRIMTAQGQELKTIRTNTSTVTIPITELKKGTYVVQCLNSDESSAKQFVVQ